ncbi:MAG TPA: TetR/AcrR family transcriptional regulator [Miltoncostaeaceae bacterium]|jgi:AcrR family transcriptional regulator|nr:TetR/AcrR family transcriptional regulator [Miltoncostaeaceae bacterium]
MADASTPARRGRPRSRANDDAILDAAVRLLAEVGYTRLSMEGVAADAGVSKPTLYLRYASKAELVAAAFTAVRMGAAPPLSGDLRVDLVAQLRHLRGTFARIGMSVVGVCLAEEAHVPDLIEALRARSLRPGRQLMRDALTAARDRGGLRPDADVEAAIEMAIGAYYARYTAGEPFDDAWDERIADAVLRSVAL